MQRTTARRLLGITAVLATGTTLLTGCSQGATGCFEAVPTTVYFINEGVTGQDKKASVDQVWAMKSTSDTNIFYLSAQVHGSGADQFAIWATTDDPEQDKLEGITISIEGVSAALSTFPQSDGGIDSNSPSAIAVRQCAMNNVGK